MNVRLKKLIGSAAILAFLAGYVWAVVSIAPFVPAAWWAQIPYFALTGILWGVPLIPLIRWMNREA